MAKLHFWIFGRRGQFFGLGEAASLDLRAARAVFWPWRSCISGSSGGEGSFLALAKLHRWIFGWRGQFFGLGEAALVDLDLRSRTEQEEGQ
ncbi:hypothetical protein [Cohnella silvisoli]|uniref:Uncharacterized protein n=1 Tax=Cohnella silvisoli TaxID=2873699 RepID=A0ABV1KRB4_9BACL|nr:hypothetical protein [Cohnella silvisoli]MCD9024525.1 hypothetical protein [Cohnella silvisoli]